MLCPDCCSAISAEPDADGTWPAPWWEYPTPPHIAVLGEGGLWRCNEVVAQLPTSIRSLGRICLGLGITQVWIHASAFPALGLPDSIPDRRGGVPHRFTDLCDDWQGGQTPGLEAWRYWYRKGSGGFDLHIPAYGRAAWMECPSAPELLARVAMFDHATGGVPWKGTGAITSDVYLRSRLRKRIAPTEHPPIMDKAHEIPAVVARPARADEQKLRYCHALDLNLAYASAASSVPLPTGQCIHMDWPPFTKQVAGIYLVERDAGTQWVTAPTMERLDAKGVHALEGWIWPKSGRHLRPWYEMIRDARAELIEGGGPALSALKDVCREGLGRLAGRGRTLRPGTTLADEPMYQPYWDWAVIAEVRERLLTRVEGLAVEPVAIDTDCLFFLTGRRTPEALAVALGLPLGDGLGQFKPAGTCSGSDARAALEDARGSRAISRLRELVK